MRGVMKFLTFAVFAATAGLGGAAACGSHDGDAIEAGLDGSSDAGLPETARSADAPSGNPDAPAPVDAGDGGVPYGDRNLHLHEPYPDALLIQNGGRLYNLRNPPSAAQHAAKGDGIADDTDAFRDAFEFLRDAYVAAADDTGNDPNGTHDLTNTWLYLPVGTYRVTDTLTYRTPIALGDGGAYEDLVRIRIAGESRESTVIQLDDAAGGFAGPDPPQDRPRVPARRHDL